MDRVGRRSPILLVKMSPGAATEAAALALGRRRVHTIGAHSDRRSLRGKDVLVIRDARRPDRVRLGRRPFDLSTAEGRRRFVEALGLDRARARAVMKVISEAGGDARDELAQLSRVLCWAEEGRLRLTRVVLSGHAGASGIRGELSGRRRNGTLTFRSLSEMARAFPVAAAQVEHLMIAACFSAYPGVLESYHAIFPSLIDVTAYPGRAPLSGLGAEPDLRRWSRSAGRMKPLRAGAVFGKGPRRHPGAVSTR